MVYITCKHYYNIGNTIILFHISGKTICPIHFLSVLAILFHESLKTNIKKEKKANIKKEKKILRETKFAITNLKNKARVPPVHFSIQCQEQWLQLLSVEHLSYCIQKVPATQTSYRHLNPKPEDYISKSGNSSPHLRNSNICVAFLTIDTIIQLVCICYFCPFPLRFSDIVIY